MGFYVEVMCDELKDWPANSGHLYNRCTTHRGDNPQGATVGEARKEAKRQGWIVKGDYACCPDCREKSEA